MHGRKYGKVLLPHCTVVCIFDSTEPKFEDALVAGIVEHQSGNLWHAVRGEGAYFNGKRIEKKEMAANRTTLVAIDQLANADYIQRFRLIYENFWVRDFGSSAFHLASVSIGALGAFLSERNKAHELGAGYLLAKEGGRWISDLEGKSMDKVSYDFNSRYPVVMAYNEAIADKLR